MKKKVLCLLVLLSCATITYSQNITPNEIEDIKHRIVEKYNDFISYLTEITAKTHRPLEERRLATQYIEKALNLFVGNGYDYQYRDAQGELRMHKGVYVNVISEDSSQNSSLLLRVFLGRFRAMQYVKYELPSLDTAELSIRLTPNMPENALYSIVDRNDKPVAYITGRKIIETPEGEDSFYIVKLSDITLIRK